MISTGREYDRFIIALVILSMFILAFYIVQCNRNNTSKLKKQETKLSDRLDYLTEQLNDTSENMKNYMETSAVESKEEVKDNIPNPVSSGFLG